MKIWVNKDKNSKFESWYAYCKPHYKLKVKASFSVRFAKCQSPMTESAFIEINDGDFVFDTEAWENKTTGKIDKKFSLTIFNYTIVNETKYENIGNKMAQSQFVESIKQEEEKVKAMFGGNVKIEDEELPFF